MSTTSNNYSQWMTIGFLVIVIGIFTLSSGWLSTSTSSAKGSATMVIDFGSGDIRTFEGSTAEKLTVLEALFASTQNAGIKLIYSVDRDNAVRISSIDGQINNVANKQWHFYLNQKRLSTEDINKILISPKDNIEVVFE